MEDKKLGEIFDYYEFGGYGSCNDRFFSYCSDMINYSKACSTTTTNKSFFDQGENEVKLPDNDYEPRLLEIDEKDIVKKEKIGRGQYGIVYKGLLKGTTPVAIKENFSSLENAETHTEARKMAKLVHRNVIKIIGVCLRQDYKPIQIVMELAEMSLRKFLNELDFELKFQDKIDCLMQISDGMKFLHSNETLHRDLKADNIVMSKRPKNSSECQQVVYKIIDLSLKNGSPSHMSPEAIIDGSYTEASDVWSFGVVVWEVFAEAEKPFSTFKGDGSQYELMRHIGENKQTLSIDHLNLDERVYRLLMETWHLDVEKRPSFQTILQTLKSIKEAKSENVIAGYSDADSQEEDYDDEYDDYVDNQYEQNETVFCEQNIDVESKENSNYNIDKNNDQQFQPNIPTLF